MPSTFTLLDLATVLRSYGRGLIFRSPLWTPTDGTLNMSMLGDTEGDLSIATNTEMANLTLPELTGPAAHEVDFMGENPVITVPMYVADPAFRALLSPMGSAHGGRSRRGNVVEHSVMILPEKTCLKPDGTFGTPTVSGGVWLLDGIAFSASQLALLGSAVWAWRCYINRPDIRFRGGGGDESKNLETVTIQTMHHPDMPEGQHLYTIGNPLTAGVNIEIGSS